MNKARQIKQAYDSSAEIYDSRYKEIQFLKYQTMLSGIELKGKILDLGCGTGLLAEFSEKKLFGLDLSFGMLKFAKKRGEIVVQASQEHLPFRPETFDAVLSFTSLQNSDDAAKTLAEAKRILRKDGIFILTHLKKFNFLKQIENNFEIQEISDCGEDCGFILI